VANETLENLSQENRKFPPSAEFTAQANGQASLYDEAARTTRPSGPNRHART
jgi:hypothetical protein